LFRYRNAAQSAGSILVRAASPEDVAARLMEESDKAKENGPQYALLTATNELRSWQYRTPDYGP
jgi:hypothetical protein